MLDRENFYYRRFRTTTVCLSLFIFALPGILSAAETPVRSDERADINCPVTLPAAGPQRPITLSTTMRRRDRSCFVAPDVVAKQQRAGKIALVDVRPSHEFERFRIPGSLNVPLHMVKTKSFLKTDPVILINDGRGSRDLEEACQTLKQAGFRQVSVLDGGIYAWSERKQSLEGDLFALRELNKLKPDDLFSERSYDDWAIISLSPVNRDTQKLLPPKVVTLKASGKTVPIAEIRNVIRSQEKLNPHVKVVIASDNDAVYPQLEQGLRTERTRVFYLMGGLSDYQAYARNQLAMLHEKDKPQKLAACRG